MLPDLLTPGLPIVFCGTAVSTTSARAGHCSSHPSNRFWTLLHEAGFTPARLRPEQDHELLQLGIGLTDLEIGPARSTDRGLTFAGAGRTVTTLKAAAPAWVAFNGLTAARGAARRLGVRTTVGLGEQAWGVAGSEVFVLPSSSAASARVPYAEKLVWWRSLRERLCAGAAG